MACRERERRTGRVPPEEIRSQAGDGPVSNQRRVFDTLRNDFNSWEVWDNTPDGRAGLRAPKAEGKLRPRDLRWQLGHLRARVKMQAG